MFALLGLEEDFKTWKKGFVKVVFPVLLGEVAMTHLATSSHSSEKGGSCECGGMKKDKCCKEKSKSSSDQVHNMRVLYIAGNISKV